MKYSVHVFHFKFNTRKGTCRVSKRTIIILFWNSLITILTSSKAGIVLMIRVMCCKNMSFTIFLLVIQKEGLVGGVLTILLFVCHQLYNNIIICEDCWLQIYSWRHTQKNLASKGPGMTTTKIFQDIFFRYMFHLTKLLPIFNITFTFFSWGKFFTLAIPFWTVLIFIGNITECMVRTGQLPIQQFSFKIGQRICR